jgi:hypothetical protein
LNTAVAEFVTHHLREGTLSKNWQRSFAAHLDKVAPAPKPRRKAPARVQLTKTDTTIAGQPTITGRAVNLRNMIANTLQLQANHPIMRTASQFCEKWVSGEWPSDLIIETIRQMYQQREGFVPESLAYYEKPIAVAYATLNSGLPAASIKTIEHHEQKTRARDPERSLVSAIDARIAELGNDGEESEG